MEKINREELMKMMNLTEEELEKVVGGEWRELCMETCAAKRAEAVRRCNIYPLGGEEYNKCYAEAQEFHWNCLQFCL